MKHSIYWRVALGLAGLALAIGCTEDAANIPHIPLTADWCGLQEGGPHASDAVETISTSPDGDAGIGTPAGVVLVQDSLLYVYDSSVPSVRVFNTDLSELRSFGRSGRGPGELSTFTIPVVVPIPDFIATNGAELFAADPRQDQITVYNLSGRYKRLALQDFHRHGWFPSMHGRFRVLADSVVLGGGGIYPLIPPSTKEDPYFHVRAHRGDAVNALFRKPMQPVPRVNGASRVRSSEALPVWDLAGRCLFYNNGHDPIVLALDRVSGNLDSVTFSIPEGLEIGYDEQRRFFQEVGMDPFPPAALEKKVVNITVDPWGNVWVELAPPRRRPSDRMVIRVNRWGEQRLDTLPAFPQVFRSDGTMYGLGFSELEMGLLWKMWYAARE